MGRFARTRSGIRVTVTEQEVTLLRRLGDELRHVYQVDDDPVYGRLFPSAYLDPSEVEAEREWQALVQPELLRARLASIEAMGATLDRAEERPRGQEIVLVDDEPEAWLAVLNDARLALGTRLGITEDTDYDDLDPEDPEAPAYEVYAWLTWLEGDLVETLVG